MRLFRISTGRDGSSWPVLLLLLTALAPLAGMAWMLRAALESEQLAVRQRLADAYRAHLERSTKDVAEHWQQLLNELSESAKAAPAEAFARCVTKGHVDSVIIWAEDGRVAYPNSSTAAFEAVDDPNWATAEKLEFADQDLAAAADSYRGIAERASDERTRALAEQALARCLLKLGNTEGARSTLERLREREGVPDGHGRPIAADAELRLLELTESGSPEAREVSKAVRDRLNRYTGSEVPADQRRFLMHRLRQLAPGGAEFPTLAAEDLAAEFLAATPNPSRSDKLALSPAGLWSISTSDGRVTALFRAESLEARLAETLQGQAAPGGISFKTRAPGEFGGDENELMTASLGPIMPGWRLAMLARGDQALDAAASRRRSLLITIGAVLLGVTAAMLWFAARGMQRQLQVARLKNDLVATVSHELKTPLASTRLLVDTLLEGSESFNGQTREYLEMISHENARLTRLIDNFLTFSRMERGKHRFSFEAVDLREVIARAVAAVRDRFDAAGAELHVEIDGPLWVSGDVEALVTAVINLLDNAWKYSGEQKRVVVRGRTVGGQVLIDVEDNGPGLTPRAAKRVFERFYQVDQQLSRSQGGCGLGLSIVKYIVDAHGGSATVDSVPGEGTTFTITLPVAELHGESDGADDWSLKRPLHIEESAS
jgi:signal transduction histidine kinase